MSITQHTLRRLGRSVGFHSQSQETPDAPTREDVFTMLSNERRRCTLYYLQQHDGPARLSDIVDYVAAWQYDQPVSALAREDRMCVYSALHQVHLPKLDEAGFIEYNDDGDIRVRNGVESARLYLEYDPNSDIAWSTVYTGLVAVGLLLGTTSYFAVYPFAGLSGYLVAGLVLVMFSLATLGHTIHEWRNKRTVADLFEVQQ